MIFIKKIITSLTRNNWSNNKHFITRLRSFYRWIKTKLRSSKSLNVHHRVNKVEMQHKKTGSLSHNRNRPIF